MTRVKGFNRARKLLTRENFWEHFTTPPGLAAQIKQVFGDELSVQEVVNRIIGEVRGKGDKALFDYTEKLDGVRLDSLEVYKREVVAAYDIVNKESRCIPGRQALKATGSALTKGWPICAWWQRCLSIHSADDGHTSQSGRCWGNHYGFPGR
jgi:hypothetical protein